MRLLFLDIDGVLNSTSYWHGQECHLPLGKSGAIDAAAVARLNAIVDQTGCDVILSSSWRLRDKRAGVEAMLRERGYRHALLDATPVLNTNRHCEIAASIERYNPERFVVMDDDPDAWIDAFADRGRFVNTNYLVGLHDNGVALAVEWLAEPGTGKEQS